MRKFLSWPVRVHLLLLVILLALPSIALIVHWGLAARDEAIEGAKIECLKFVTAIAGEQQSAVAGVQQLVTTLALLPEVKSRNSPAVDALLADLLKKNPLYANIVISYKSGVLWATATPAGAPFEGTLSIAGRKYFQDAVRSGTFSSGEFSIGRIGKKPLITFAQPITNAADELTNVIAVSLNLEHIQSLFEKIDLPGGSSFSLLDHQGVILFRNSRDPFSEQLVGKRDFREEIFTKMVEGPDEGTYEAMGNDGKVRLTAYRKLRLPHESQPYLYVRSSIPKAMVVSKANSAMLRNMAALASVFAVGLILAVFIGKRMIADPIAKLKEASRQMASGPAPVNVSGQVKDGKLGELAQAFDDMAEALLRKEKDQLAAEAELRASEERLLTVLNSITEGYYTLDSEWRFVEMNKVTERHFGHPAAELTGRQIWKLTNTPPDSPLYRQYDSAVRENLPRHFESESQINPGMWSELHLYPRDGSLDVYFRDITQRKQAETALQNTLQRFYIMLAGMYCGVLLMTDKGEVEFVNQAFCDFYGLKEAPTDLVGLASRDLLERIRPAFLHPDEAAARIAEILQRGEPVRGEEFAMQGGRMAMRDFVPLSVRGESCGRLWIHVDITELKQAEEALRMAKAELEERVKERTYELYAESVYARSLIEASLDPLVTINVDGKITDVNRASEEATGVSREQLIGNDFSDYFTEPEKARAGYEEVFRQGFVRDYPLDIKHRDGHVTPVLYNATLYRDEAGEAMGVFAAARDITLRKRAEEAVKAERRRLFDVLETLPAMICLLTPDYHVAFANKSFRDRFGESQGRHCYDYCYGKTEPCDFCESYRVLKTGQPHQWEVRTSDGSVIAAYDYPFTDTDGSPLILEMDLDITAHRKAEAELVRHRDHLMSLTEQLENSRNELRKLASELVMAEERERKRIAGVLHDDIAQILATVRMRLDILEGLPSDQQATLKEAKALLQQSIQETRTLMTDIGNPLLFDMGLKAACESLAKRLMDRHAVRIRCDILDAYKHLNPDVKTILFQVIRELLNNVVKHSGARNAHVTIDMDNGQFSMKVTDDGAGFDPQMLGAPTVEGGFGLYSIRERLLAIGGSLRIESAPGTGTVVTAILPAALD